VLLAALLLLSAQPRKSSPPSRGFFKRGLGLALGLEVLGLVCVAALSLCLHFPTEWSFRAAPWQMALLTAGLGCMLLALLFSLGVTSLFTSAVMVSYQSPLHAPFARSKAQVADGLGGAVGLGLLLLADLGRWSPAATLLAPLAGAVAVHLFIAVFNCLHPHAAGRGVQLETLQW
jgi:hypothetical protein